MTNPRMPAGMRPRISDYGFNAPKGAEQTPVEGGVDRFALAYESAAKVFSVSLVLDLYEFSIWNLFFERKTAMGTITFDIDLDSGHGIAPHPCNIVADSYSAKRSAGSAGMVVTFQVQAESQSFDFSDADIDDQLFVYELLGKLAPSLLSRLTVFANTDTLAMNSPVIPLASRDIDPAISFSREGSKTYFDDARVLRAAPTNIWPLEFDPITRKILGRRVEPARRNFLRRSSEFTNSVWSKTAGTTVVASSRVAPDGTLTAGLMQSSIADGSFGQNNSVTGGVAVVMSVWLCADAPATIRIYAIDSGAVGLTGVLCNVTTSWQRFEVTRVMGTASTSVSLQIGGGSSFGIGRSMHVWGAQAELASAASSYKPTVAAGVDRSADIAQLSVPANRTLLTYSFSDGTSATVAVRPGAVHTVPEMFFPKYITRMMWG